MTIKCIQCKGDMEFISYSRKICHDCVEYKKNNRSRLYYSENKDCINAKRKLNYLANLESDRARSRRYYLKNVDKISVRNKKNYEADKEARKLNSKQYHAEHKDAINAKAREKYALKKTTKTIITITK